MAYCAYCGSHVDQVSFVPCASCGNPTNGAPPRPPARAGNNTAMIIVGVVVAAFAVLFVIGILAAIAIPNLITATERAKQKRTMADMRSVATALEAWRTDHTDEKGYPSGESVESLRPFLQPVFIKNLVTKDAWETEMRYVSIPPDGYLIVSAGKDKTFDYDAWNLYQRGETENFDCDLVFSNGEFVQYPKNIAGGR